jgi:peptidoglycan-associated lipoprotein
MGPGAGRKERPPQLFDRPEVLGGQPMEKMGAPTRHADKHAAAVRRIAPPLHKARALAPVHQPYRALVLDLQSLSQLGDGRRPALRAPNEQEELILSRRNPCLSRNLAGRPQETAHRVSPVREGPIVRVAEGIEAPAVRHAPEYRTADISCYDVLRGASKMKRTLFASGIALIVLLTLTSCQKKAPTSAAQAREARPTPSTPPQPVRPAPAPVTGDDVMAQDLMTINRHGYLKDVFFDFDESNLRDDARATLSTDAHWLGRYGSIQFLVEGHCDERGTEAYNLALGDRRANAVREYLTSLGIDASRIKTVSYGKERPSCTESSDSCWQENRRDHFLVTAK